MAETPILAHLARTLGLVVLPVFQGSTDPFNPDMRWVYPAPATDQWIPCDVAMAGSENLVWVSAVGREGRWSVLDAAGKSVGFPRAPRFQDAAPVASITSVKAVAGRRADALYGLRQEVVAGIDKRSEVFRYNPLKAAQGAAFDPEWTYNSSVVSRGSALVATDGEGQLVVLAVHDANLAQVELTWLDGLTGAQLHQMAVPGAGLNALEISDQGERVALAAGLDTYVFDGSGTQIEHIVRTAATPALALSSTGRVLALGGSSRLDVWVKRPGGYRLVRTLNGSPVELATRVALSADGTRLAVTWWDRTTGIGLRLETWDMVSATRLINYSQNGIQGGFQNVAEALQMTSDGGRVALGTWGLAGIEPEVLLFEVDDPTPVFSADLPGSVHDLALDSTGSRIVVAYKDAHANQFSSSGGVRFFDTGERDLQQLLPPVYGDQIRLAASRPGSGSVLFLVGDRAREPILLPGIGGAALGLEPSGLRIYPRRTDPAGVGEWGFRVPDDPSWLGIPWSAQAAFRVGGTTELSEVVLDPLILNP